MCGVKGCKKETVVHHNRLNCSISMCIHCLRYKGLDLDESLPNEEGRDEDHGVITVVFQLTRIMTQKGRVHNLY